MTKHLPSAAERFSSQRALRELIWVAADLIDAVRQPLLLAAIIAIVALIVLRLAIDSL